MYVHYIGYCKIINIILVLITEIDIQKLNVVVNILHQNTFFFLLKYQYVSDKVDSSI